MPVIDYSNYTANQSEWAHSLLKMATRADAVSAQELGKRASDALKRVVVHLPKQPVDP